MKVDKLATDRCKQLFLVLGKSENMVDFSLDLICLAKSHGSASEVFEVAMLIYFGISAEGH